MRNDRYDLVFDGRLVEGHEAQEVRRSFAEMFSVGPEKTASLFSGTRTILNTGLVEDAAEHYRQRFHSIGMVVDAVPRLGSSTTAGFMDSLYEPVVPGEPQEPPPGPDQASQAMGPVPEARRAPFRFFGSGREYFGIWIVNVLLSIVTLGIYSAWAKVRNKQYFYGNTELSGSTFQYTGDPVRILIGRCIAAVMLLIYFMADHFSLFGTFVAFVLLLAFTPWAIRHSLRFNARNSRYRNIPFSFRGTLGDAFRVFLLWPFLGIITAGILIPYTVYKQQAYIIGNHWYGHAPFRFTGEPRDYYRVYLIIMGIVLGAGICLFLVILAGLGISLAVLGTDVLGDMGRFGGFLIVLFLLANAFYVALYLFIYAYHGVSMANIRYNNSFVERHRLGSHWKTASYAKLVFVNTLLTVLTLGLFKPWAKVRAAAYAANHTTALVAGNLDAFVEGEQEAVSALGEGVGDIFNLDVGI